MKLNAFYKKKLLEFVNHRVVDVEKLNSYVNYGHGDQNFSRFSEPDEEDWDIDEEYKAQGQEAVDCIKADGLWEWTNIPDGYQEQAIKFISLKTGCEA